MNAHLAPQPSGRYPVVGQAPPDLRFRPWPRAWLVLATAALFLPARVAAQQEKLVYPPSRRGDQVDTYHGQQVADPYRWLEDVDSPETKAWVTAENKLTFGYLERLPQRAPLKSRLTQLWNFERFGIPRQRGGRYFYTRNNGLQNQSVLLVADSLAAEPRALVDPNRLSSDGTVAMSDWSPSDDGRYLAYGLTSGGSDWQAWKVKDVATGRDLADHLRWIKFSGVSWTPDNRGFYYSRYDEPKTGTELTGTNYFQKLCYHRLGEPQEQDTLIYERKDQKEWGFEGEATEDGRYLIIRVWRGTERKNQIFYRPLDKPDAPVVELLAGFDAEYQFVGNDGGVFWMLTDASAPRRRVVAIDVTQPAREHWREVIPEAPSAIRDASVVGDRLLVSYLEDAKSRVRVFDLTGKPLGDVPLPGLGTANGFHGRRQDRETFYSFANFTTPATIFRYAVARGESSVFRQPRLDFPPGDYETKQVFYPSKDGTKVPMFLTHKKGVQPNGQNQLLLFGYGGFDISVTPDFSVTNLVWVEAGGVYAVPNLRGGGEYGRAWHEAGMLDRKQNVFDDFIAAAEWLIQNGWTSPQKLAIRGGSNGGLLVGAVMTQRPDLFGAALPAVGVMDMLRFHKFTIGWAWVSEYGSADDAQQFQTLLRYSPLHHLKPGTKYPATLITTADHDDRVVPGHSFKFAAQLQHAQVGDAPVLIRIETRAGHGAGTPTAKRIEEAADLLAFLQAVLE
jgi:prolyl oligopeptidase